VNYFTFPAKRLLKFLPIVAGLALCNATYGQSDPDSSAQSPWSANLDVVSRYMWRGTQQSQSPAFQPYASYENKGFTLGAWGSQSFAIGENQEIDLYATYTLKKLALTVTDYFVANDSMVTSDYFGWDQKITGHTLELALTIDGPEVFPAQLIIGTFIYGYDLDENGDNYYSTYIEINHTWEHNDISLKPYIGITPMSGYYSADGLQCVNLGMEVGREIEITDKFALPVGVNFTLNPYMENAYFTVKLSL